MNLFYFNVNKVCNSNCCFCAANYEDLYLNEKGNPYISIDKFKEIAIKMDISKNDKVIINGGEPTLNPHLIDILEFCDINEFKTILFTNGRKLSDNTFVNEIVKKNPSKITIPLYGHNAELHNSLTRNNDSFNETVKALKNLSELHKNNQFIFEIKILICRSNYRFITDIAKYLIDNFKFDILMISGLIPSDVALKNNQIVDKESHKEAINSFLNYFWKCNCKLQLTLDGIPLCHIDNNNLVMYLINRKSLSDFEIEKPNKNYSFDIENLNDSNILSDNTSSLEIEMWDKPQCHKEECKYKYICRLNTLINHNDFLREWIS
ncbi:MAG: radical SAM protein [Oscillospiraceae bacterium]|nr:radical SAM protein [Oscillospiraceae bacterium]